MKKRYGVLIMAILLAGCSYAKSGAAAEDAYYGNSNAAYGGYEVPAEAEYADYDYEEAKGASEEGYLAESDTMTEQEAAITGEKLVYTGNMRIETLTYDETLNQLKDLINKYNGITQNQNENINDYYWYREGADHSVRTMSLTLRIPTDKFNSFMDDMQGTGKVMSRSVNVENITRQYNDNAVLIASLELQEERLLDMMEKAETIEDMIIVEERLTEVQTQLNQLKMYKSSMDTDIEYSTIWLTVNEVREYQDSRPDFMHQMQEAFVDGFSNFAYAMGSLLLVLTESLPFLICLAVILFVLFKVLKKKNFLNLKKVIFRKKDSE